MDLVCRELGCVDARLEIGGRPPDDPLVLCAEISGGFRLVAVFEAPPDNPKDTVRRLENMGASFFDLGIRPPSVRPDADSAGAQRRLDDELSALCGRTGATSALVVDATSPILWGSSEARSDHWNVDAMLELASLTAALSGRGISLRALADQSVHDAESALQGAQLPHALERRAHKAHERLAEVSSRTRRARFVEASVLAELRADSAGTEGSPTLRRLVHRDGDGYLARSFAAIYVLVLCFDEEFSELHVEGAALHALPIIERYVMMLPPIEPPPRGGRVVRFPRPDR